MLPFTIFFLLQVFVTVMILRDLMKQSVSETDETEDQIIFMTQLILCWVPFVGLLVSIMLWLEYRYYAECKA